MQLPHSSSHLPIHHLSGIFKSTSASYKYYWLLSILKDIEVNDRQDIPRDDLLIRMIAMSWFPINFYKLSFGKSDSLDKIIKEILLDKELQLNLKSTEEEVLQIITTAFQQGNKTIKKAVNTLSKNVPHLFLSPFFKDQLKETGKNHTLKKQVIVSEAIHHYHKTNTLPFYKLETRGKEAFVVLHLHWMDYFKIHLSIIRDFCYWNLLTFLQKRNPNVPNIANKLFPPQKRASLEKAHNFWNLAYAESPDLANCIFSNQSLLDSKFDMDHFIPWSFVTHNQLWNLIPIIPSVNSAKSNQLPDLDKYFSSFARQHHAAFKINLAYKKKKRLEDYIVLLKMEVDAIRDMKESTFERVLLEHISPLHQIARNSGFGTKWTYQENSSSRVK